MRRQKQTPGEKRLAAKLPNSRQDIGKSETMHRVVITVLEKNQTGPRVDRNANVRPLSMQNSYLFPFSIIDRLLVRVFRLVRSYVTVILRRVSCSKIRNSKSPTCNCLRACNKSNLSTVTFTKEKIIFSLTIHRNFDILLLRTHLFQILCVVRCYQDKIMESSAKPTVMISSQSIEIQVFYYDVIVAFAGKRISVIYTCRKNF